MGVIIFIIVVLISLTFVDAFLFRKIVIQSIERIDSERRLIKVKAHAYFSIIRLNVEYIELKGGYYMKLSDTEVSTNELEPSYMKKALLKYELEKGLND
jgi:hypothetical protein